MKFHTNILVTGIKEVPKLYLLYMPAKNQKEIKEN
uniref:Uncharacterized protein n=1 Tax=Arundo donax TaxID=35708 RepID=A0A0A9G1C8_ARUDO